MREKYNEKFMQITLIGWLLDKYPNCTIALEVPFMDKGRRIDVLVISQDLQLHIFEIKSKVDQLTKLKDQINDYCVSFEYVNIVFDPKFFSAVRLMNIPEYIGNISINIHKDIEIQGNSKKSQNLNIINMLSILKKNEILELCGKKKQTIAELRELAVQLYPTSDLQKSIGKLLLKRYEKQNTLFNKYKHKILSGEDLIYLRHSTHSFWI